jgi:hypothetical protein
MKVIIGIVVIAAVLTLGASNSEAGQKECWNHYNDAWAKMKKGNHSGYEISMRKYNNCMNRNWEGPVPKKKKHSM